jgi:Pex14 N-terminal domain
MAAMVAREDLVNSAVCSLFQVRKHMLTSNRSPVRVSPAARSTLSAKLTHAVLQDPSVAGSPLDKRRAFLESKNLTPEEVQLALARAGEDPSTTQAPYNYPPPQRAAAAPGYGYYQGGYPGQWPPQPMEPPRRDWRDWFIMATVTTGVGYGLYTLAKAGFLYS